MAGTFAIGSKWLFSQEASTVLLFLILCAIGAGAWYGVPAALRQIQAGYESLEIKHAAERNEVETRYLSERKEMREDTKADRQEFRANLEKLGSAVDRLSEKVK